MQQKKVVLINDLSGLGRCSLSVELPVLSVMGFECLLLPTAVLSNHTGYNSYFLHSLDEQMRPWMEEWKKQRVECDAILTGFLGSAGQVREVLHFFDLFQKKNTLTVVDPVLGDGGKLYSSCTEKQVRGMRELCSRADVILPNLTEACLLCDLPWKKDFSPAEIERMAEKLTGLGPDKAVISGIEEEHHVLDLVFEKGKKPVWIRSVKTAAMRSGTGDLFASVLTGSLMQNEDLVKAAERAGDFVRLTLQKTAELHVPAEEGCAFELVLPALIPGCSPEQDRKNRLRSSSG